MNRSDEEAQSPHDSHTRRHRHHAPNVQQDALRRLTSNRSAASIVPPGVAAAPVAASMNAEDRRIGRTMAASVSNVEENVQPAGRGDAEHRSAASPSRQNNPIQQPPRHQYHQYAQRPNNNQPSQQSAPSATTKPKADPPQGKEGWTVITPAPLSPSLPPCQRSLHAAAVVNDSLYVFGGYDGQNRVNDFYQYHFPTGVWREIITVGNGVLVGGTHQGNNVAGNADMAAVGGANNGGERANQRVLGGNISATGSVPTPRDRHAAVVHNNCFYVFGGFDGQSRVSDLYEFDVDRLVWREVRPHVPNAPNNIGAVGQGGARRVGFNIVDAGGGGADGAGNNMPNLDRDRAWLNMGQQDQVNRNGIEVDFHQELPHQQQQQQVDGRQHHAPPSPRHSHSAVVHRDSMWVFGGYDGSYRSDFHEFDFVSSSWRPVFASGRTPRARYRATACVHEDMMILFGGHDGTRHLSDVHTFDFLAQNWSLLMTDGVPPLPRDSHVSVVYKNSMYVFGGSTGSAMNDLHELTFPTSSEEHLRTDTLAAPDYNTLAGSTANIQDEGGETISIAKWRQIPPVPGGGIAVHRFCHVGAVYNGAFYVFGGYDGGSRLNDFVKYDLALDDLFDTAVPSSTLLTDLQSFLHDEGYLSVSDITIMVESIPIQCHKVMLMRCPYFRAMLLSEMAESNQTAISIEIVRHPIFMAVLEYLYTDDVLIPLDSAMELFVAADLFGIPRLQAMCEKKLLESISVENAATIFYAADIHSATSLRNKALGYVLSHFEAVSKTSAFEDMARCNVDLVVEILKSR